MFTRVIVALVAVAVGFAILGASPHAVGGKAAVGPVKDLYDSRCASCHGTSGHGDGSAAAALGTVVPDLTRLSAGNGGEFPATRVRKAIAGDPGMPLAHAISGTPVWGDALFTIGGQSAAIPGLVDYIRALQAN